MKFPPPSTIGVLGGGQLGRMLALEARRAGHRIAIFTDEPPGCPAGQFADIEINAAYDNLSLIHICLGFEASVALVLAEIDLFHQIEQQDLALLPWVIRESLPFVRCVQNRQQMSQLLFQPGLFRDTRPNAMKVLQQQQRPAQEYLAQHISCLLYTSRCV